MTRLLPSGTNSYFLRAKTLSALRILLVWKAISFEFSSTAIDTYLSSLNRMGGNRYLCNDELPGEFLIQGQSVAVEENVFVHDALYPVTEEDINESVISLPNILGSLMAEEFLNIGFLCTGQTVTEQLYLFDPHPVNENRTHDLANDINNLARLFQCDTFPALASLLLSNAALDGSVRQYSIARLTFRSSTFSENIQNLTMHETAKNSATKPKAFGRTKKIKPGRPKILKTTREEQVKEAKKRYSQLNPETNRDAVRRYEDGHFGVGQGRVQCEARLFEKEKDRNKWCCGEGAYNVTRLLPLSTPFYLNRHFMNAPTTTYFLFAPSKFLVGTGPLVDFISSRSKEECTTRRTVWTPPVNGLLLRSDTYKFVNRYRLYIYDGEQRRNIAMGRSLDIGTIDAIANYLDSINPFIGDFRRLGNGPSVNAHLEF
ncbi:hypothetical protein J6590_057144 [Homalodisca vitripennis]|nr:hypothetical protein J6590_057144 [Homalodisca vitripennis]